MKKAPLWCCACQSSVYINEKLDKAGRSMGSRLEHSKTFTLGQSRTADEIKMLPVLNWTSSSSSSISWRWWWLWWWLRTSSHWRWRQKQTSHQGGHKVNAQWGSKHMTAIIIKHTKEHYVPNKPGGMMRLTGAALNFEGGLLLFQILGRSTWSHCD